MKIIYKEDILYKTASLKTTNKLKAEIQVKAKAATSMYLSKEKSTKYVDDSENEKEEIIFIKEGTMLGRTMTDKELLESEEFRNEEDGYKNHKPYSTGTDEDKKDEIIGNYLRIIMRDLDKTPVEDVEDYMKLDILEDLDWFELFYWVPFTSGGVDLSRCGPEHVFCPTPGEIAVGIVHWTNMVKFYHGGNNRRRNTRFL